MSYVKRFQKLYAFCEYTSKPIPPSSALYWLSVLYLENWQLNAVRGWMKL